MLDESAMKILIVTPTTPPNPGKDDAGVYRRLNMIADALATIGDVEVLHYAGRKWFDSGNLASKLGASSKTTVVPMRDVPPRWLRAIYALIRPRLFFSLSGRTQVAAVEACLDRQPDLIFVHRLAAMAPFFRVRSKVPPILFDLDDVEHWVRLRAAFNSSSWLLKIIRFSQVPAIFFAERRAAKLASKTFICSEKDRRYLIKIGMGERVAVVPNAIRMPPAPAFCSDPTILFLGTYIYYPNVEAAHRLASRIWPLVLTKVPNAKLIIAGMSPQNIPAFHLNPDRTEFTGFVEDLDALYARSRLICCPLINGGGTRLKLIEAASLAKPIVSTAIGSEGLSYEDESEILIRNDDEDIAEACVRLLLDDTLCVQLGNAARKKTQSLYEISNVQKKIQFEIEDIAKTTRRKS